MLQGWRVADGPTAYLPDTLYEYLDGGAPRYLSYGFRKLLHIRYETASPPHAGVTLDLFDMGDSLAAFGIYRSGLGETDTPREWCTEGYRSESVGAGWKGSLFVHVLADNESPDQVALIEKLLERTCQDIVGERSFPAILDLLPEEGRVPRSERYIPADLLGHEFLPGGVLASYEYDGRRAQIFLSDLGNAASATEALARLREHHGGRGEIIGEASSIGAAGFRFSTSGHATGVAVAVGRHIAGIQGSQPPEVQDRLLGSFVGKLTSAGQATPFS